MKELHDDGNAAIIPGMWTSVKGDRKVVLRFVGKGLNHFFRTSDRRLCWFYGWVPHKTEVLGSPETQASGKMGEVERIHNSSFNKPFMEFLALVLFSKEHMKEVVDSYRA